MKDASRVRALIARSPADEPHVLLGGYDVFAPDVQGFGRSTRPEGHVTTDAAAADLAAVVAAVRACRGRQKIGMVAWSWGTQYAGLFVMAHPDAVSRYVSYAQMHVGSADLARGRARLDFYRSHAWTVVPREGWKARFRSGTPDDVTDPAVMERFADAASAVETRTSTGPQLDMVTRLPLVDPARIAVPTLMMSGYHNSTELMNKAYAMGSAYVNKPVGVAEMRRIMSEGLVAEATLDEQVGRTLLRLATSRTLTAAEVEVLVLALEFETGEGILERRGVTRNTHKAQVASLLQKLGVARLTEAARLVFTEAAGDRAR